MRRCSWRGRSNRWEAEIGKTIGKIAIGAAIIGAAFATGGASLVPTLGAGTTAVGVAGAVGVTTFATGTALATTALGSSLLLTGAGLVIGGASQALGLGPKVPAAQLSRLNLSFDPNASRKIAFGQTALGTDVVYWEPSGTDDEYADYIIVCAAHAVESIDEVWLDDKLAWNGTTQSPYTGYLTITAVTEGVSGSGIAINGGATWNANCSLTGCAYIHVRIKRSGNDKKTASPLVNGLPSRMTIRGKGMSLYDPRQDSTNGGSGSMRPDDQTTWAYTGIGQNTALQKLSYLLGWKIGGVLSVGAGLPPERLDMADFITAANACEASIAITGGGSHATYETAGMFDDSQAPNDVIQVLATHMNGVPRDLSGKLGLRIAHNDLSGSLLELDEDDLWGAMQWDPGPGINDTINIVRGRCTDSSDASLHQLAPYTQRSVTSADGIDRALTLDLPLFQNFHRSERVAEQVLQRAQVQGRLTAPFGPRALAADEGTPVKFSCAAKGWTDKLFRVERQVRKVILNEQDMQTFCEMVLVEESTAIYTAPATTLPDSAVTTPSYDPLSDPLALTVGFSDDIVSRLSDTTGAALDTFVRDTGLPYAGIVDTGVARDGDTVTFSSTLPSVPRIVFGPGGNGATAGQNILIAAVGLTTSGFTMVAKSQAVTPGSTITDGSASAGSGAEPDYVINRTNSGAPFDGAYKFTYSVTVGLVGGVDPGTITVGIFVKISSAWVQVGEASHNTSGTGVVTVTPGTVDFGAGNEFGVSMMSAEGTGTSLTGFTSVVYTLGTTTDTSLTPSGASGIQWTAIK